MLKRVNDLVEKVFLYFSVILLSIFMIVVFVKVIARNYLKLPLLWADEISLLCFLWTVFLGAAVAVRYKQHFIVDLAPSKVKLNLCLDILSHFIVLSLIYVMIFHGYKFTMMGFSRFSTALSWPLAFTFAPIPISGAAMFLFTIEQCIKDVKKLFSLDRKEVIS